MLPTRSLFYWLVEAGLDVERKLVGGRCPLAIVIRLEQRIDLLLDVDARLFPDREFCLLVRQTLRVRKHDIVAPDQWFEESPQLEVIALQNRIKLMIVTAGTCQSHPDKHVCGHIGDFVE